MLHFLNGSDCNNSGRWWWSEEGHTLKAPHSHSCFLSSGLCRNTSGPLLSVSVNPDLWPSATMGFLADDYWSPGESCSLWSFFCLERQTSDFLPDEDELKLMGIPMKNKEYGLLDFSLTKHIPVQDEHTWVLTGFLKGFSSISSDSRCFWFLGFCVTCWPLNWKPFLLALQGCRPACWHRAAGSEVIPRLTRWILHENSELWERFLPCWNLQLSLSSLFWHFLLLPVSICSSLFFLIVCSDRRSVIFHSTETFIHELMGNFGTRPRFSLMLVVFQSCERFFCTITLFVFCIIVTVTCHRAPVTCLLFISSVSVFHILSLVLYLAHLFLSLITSSVSSDPNNTKW